MARAKATALRAADADERAAKEARARLAEAYPDTPSVLLDSGLAIVGSETYWAPETVFETIYFPFVSIRVKNVGKETVFVTASATFYWTKPEENDVEGYGDAWTKRVYGRERFSHGRANSGDLEPGVSTNIRIQAGNGYGTRGIFYTLQGIRSGAKILEADLSIWVGQASLQKWRTIKISDMLRQ
jgi:hypothetical protein